MARELNISCAFAYRLMQQGKIRTVALTESMLALHQASASARLPDEKERFTRQIQFTDRQIDQLVYQLYGLTAAEIQIVESAS